MEHAIEAHRARTSLDDEIKRLSALLSQAADQQEQIRREHAHAMAAKDQDLREAEERHAGQERRMLAEVDRARQSSRLAEQAALLAQAQSQGSALQQRLEDLERQLGEEGKSHEDTRGLLAGALAAVRNTDKPPRKPTVRRGKSFSPEP